MTTPGCPRCTEHAARLEEALQERDRALLELARAREALARVRSASQWADEEEVPPYPLEAGAAWPVPLRYRVVDAVNLWGKRALPGVQRLARGLLGRSRRG
jgi:hypothetical protein